MSASSTLPDEALRPDEVPLAEYRSISRAAVAAVLLGVASALVLVSPLLAPVAIAAIVVACLALRAIAASKGQLIGWPAAVTGLCLACLFVGWGFSRHLSRQSQLRHNAVQIADAWIRLVQAGKLTEALEFRKAASSRISSPEALAEHYVKNAEAVKELEQLKANNVVKNLLAHGAGGKVRFDGFTVAAHEGPSDRFVLAYTGGVGEPDAKPFWLHLARQIDETSKRADWQVAAATDSPPLSSQ